MEPDWYADDKATLGDRITAARESAGLERRELAQQLGVRLRTLRGWEHDEREPRANQVQMLAGMLGVSLIWLMTGRGEGPVLASSDGGNAGTLAELRALRQMFKAADLRLARLEKVLAND
ncbi:MAG: helix-turn-helix domain-containing protein [Paracoccus sp. (in: a-proteobacteria)]|uniref:helix-turn-helix domain-containing protein n=1 Tax=Paracoccus sp. TaxID=267 RepID=UPI0026DFA083|nr:helix-turn-helix domain-containing protein [Paracoccus sp. (in: a-proteobacteria)]MDO5630382.1 helix-turn-helix domain-containing protein [Paracoccus sp. (in: a-proteobacteria)]